MIFFLTNMLSTRVLKYLIILLLFSCQLGSSHNIEFEVLTNTKVRKSNINKNLSTNVVILKRENIFGVFTNILSKDTFLICGNLRSNKLISIYSLKSKKLITEIINRGVTLNEGLSVSSISNDPSLSNVIWVYDITLGKIFKVDINRAIRNSSYIPEKEIILDGKRKNIISPSLINDSTFIATTYSLDNYRYLYITNQSILKGIGQLPEITNKKYLIDPLNTKFPNKAFLLKAFLVKHDVANKIGIFYNKTDRAEFYLNDKLKYIYQEKDNYPIAMRVNKLTNGYSIEDSNKTRYTYLSVTSSDKLIFCLYDSAKYNEATSNSIIVFDWDGNLLYRIKLNRPVCKIAVNSENNRVYCYEKFENSIYSFDLKLK
jgi:hypothetical protein